MSIALYQGEVLQVVVDANATTTESPVTATWADQGNNVGKSSVVTTGTVAIPVVSGPTNINVPARVLSSINIFNADTVAHSFTVQQVSSTGHAYNIVQATLQPGYTYAYENGTGWRMTDTNGNFRETVQAYQAGTWTVGVNNFPALQAVNLTQLDSAPLGAPSNYGTSPGAVAVQGVNAYVTNTPAVTQSGTWNVGVTGGSVGILPGSATIGNVGLNAGVNVIGGVTQSGTWAVTTTPPSNASTNITQFGGNSVATGTGAGGVGIPRVTVSNDSTHPVTQSGAWTVAANAGTGTFTVSDTNFVAQGSSTSGEKGLLTQAAVTASVPTYTTAQTSPLSLTTFGGLRTAGSASAVFAAVVTGTTPQNLSGAPRVNISALYVVSIGAVLASGSVNLIINDGGGTTRINVQLPTATATAMAPFTCIDVQELNIPLVQSGSSATCVLSANLTGGSFLVCASSV